MCCKCAANTFSARDLPLLFFLGVAAWPNEAVLERALYRSLHGSPRIFPVKHPCGSLWDGWRLQAMPSLTKTWWFSHVRPRRASSHSLPIVAALLRYVHRFLLVLILDCAAFLWIFLFWEMVLASNSCVLTIERTTKTGWNILYVPSSLVALPNYSLGRSLHRVWPTQLPLYRTKHRNSISISAQLLHLQEWVLAHAKNTLLRILFDSGDWS